MRVVLWALPLRAPLRLTKRALACPPTRKLGGIGNGAALPY